MREFICYHPPKGNCWGHTLRHRTAKRAWDAIDLFLTRCTIAEPVQLRRFVVHGDRPWGAAGDAETHIAAATAAFGPNERVSLNSFVSPAGVQTDWQDLVWGPERVPFAAALDFLAAREPWPKRRSNAVSANIEVSFQWRNPDTGELLANQDVGFATDDGALRSTLHIELGQRTHIGPDIRLPFPEGSPRLPPFLRFIQSGFPATLHEKHFRVATPRSKGTGYAVRRLVISPFTAA
jgi:hypothetical protein